MNRRDFLRTGIAALAAGAVSGSFSTVFASGKKLSLKIGYLPITDHLTMIAAEREKFPNVTIQPIKFSSWPEISEALKANKIDGAFLLTPIGLTLRQKGIPVKVIRLGHRNGSVITVKNSDEINSISDLRGKTIAIPSPFSTHNILLRKVLSEKGIDPARDLKIIDMAPPEMVVALATGRIHGYIVAEPFGAQAEAQKVGKILILSKDIWQNHICCVLNVQEKLIENYPSEVQELVSGFLRTAEFIEADPDQAARISTKLLGQKPEVVKAVLTTPRDRLTFQNLVPAEPDFAATQDYMLKFGIAEKKVDLSAYLDNRFARKKA
jgi:NitT/TauT family transport system substrate-binding protein